MNLTLNEIARALGGEISNGSVLAPGPNHSKNDRSLSVKLSSNKPEGFVVHSFSGDDALTCKDYVREKLNVEAFTPGQRKTSQRAANLNTRGASNDIAPPSKANKESIYTFVEPATGEVKYRKKRIDKDGSKTFFFEPRQRGGSEPLLYGGEYLNSIKGEKSSLYVLIVEGEKKVDELRRRGFVAVSGDSGANSKWTPEHGQLLSGFKIILWPDSDDIGEKYISSAVKVIKDASPDTTIKVIRPFPSAAPGEKGKDVCDWTGSNDELKALIDGAVTYAPPGASVGAKSKFKIEKFEDIKFEAKEEWAIKGVLPKQGVAAVYGPPSSFKSFVASDIAFNIALNKQWAGRRVLGAPVIYVAAEGASGFRKRKAGFELHSGKLPANVPFHLISAAPNLGTEKNDLEEFIGAIEQATISPGLIVIDTLAQTLNSADENGAGMVQFIANANALAARFKCLVLVVHHTGKDNSKGMRGHSSLNGAMDAVLLCERREGELSATLTIQKLKDEASDTRLSVKLARVVIGADDDGDDISTLVVESIEDAAPVSQEKEKRRGTSPNQRLLMSAVTQSLIEAGEEIRPWADGPKVKAVPQDVIRKKYYEMNPVEDSPDEDAKQAVNSRWKKFKRNLSNLVDAKAVISAKVNNTTYLWLPDVEMDTWTCPIDTRPSMSIAAPSMADGRKWTNVHQSPSMSIVHQEPVHPSDEIVEEEI